MPALVSLGLWLMVPYATVHSLPLSARWRAAVYRYIYLCLFSLSQAHLVKTCLKRLHNTIRDDRYLVGRKLLNK